MNPVTRAKKIAAPDPFQTDEEIAIFSRIDPFQFICESDWPLFPNANYPAGGPFFVRPIFSSKKGCLVTGRRQRASDASQIGFRTAAGRKAAPNKSNVQFLGSLYLHAVSTIIVPMSGETLNPTAPPRIAPRAPRLPKSLLYSIFARIGGWGLDTDAFETLRASYRGGFLGKAIAYDNRQNEIPASKIRSLRWHPVRLLSSLDRPYYYGAKKKYLDWIASRELGTGQYDLFNHGDPDKGLQLGAGKTNSSCVRSVPSKNTTLPRYCWSFQKKRPRLFARAGWRTKNFSIFHAELMSNVSNLACVRQSFARFFPAR